MEWLNELHKPIKTVISYLSILAGAIADVGSAIILALAGLRVAGFAALADKLAAALPMIGFIGVALAGIALGISRVTRAIKDLRTAPIDEAVESLRRIFSGLLDIPLIPRGVAEWVVRKLEKSLAKSKTKPNRRGGAQEKLL